jgi:hypothetical protein
MVSNMEKLPEKSSANGSFRESALTLCVLNNNVGLFAEKIGCKETCAFPFNIRMKKQQNNNSILRFDTPM